MKKSFIIFFSTITFYARSLFSPGKVMAAIDTPNSWLQTINPGFGVTGSNLGGFGIGFFTHNIPSFVISVAVFILLAVSFIFLLFGGIMWITSGGNKEGAKKAKDTVTYAVIGLALGLLSFVFVNILGTFFGVNLVNP